MQKKQLKKFLEENLDKAKEILIEDFLNGEEMSFFILYDNKHLKFLILLKIIKEYLKEIKVKILVVWELILHQD